jgi:FlaG/FlaF family flagellin (archaellin)
MKKSCENNSADRISGLKRIRSQKKAVSPWISWVLLVAFAVMLSAFMYNFMVSYTKSSTTDMKKVVYNTDECRLVSINIEDACRSSQVLNITLQNRNYIRIDSIDFRLYNDRVPIHTNLTNISMNPNRKKVVSLDTGTSTETTRIEVIPHITKENMDIICAEKKASKEVTVC